MVILMRAGAAVLLLAIAASCGGGKMNFDQNYRRDTPYRYDPNPPYYYPTNDPFPYDPPYAYDPLVRYPAELPLAPRRPADLLSRHLAEFSGAFGGNFAQLHQQLPFGYHALDHTGYVMASPGVELTPDPADPRRASLTLRSELNTVSFMTYGLLGMPGQRRVLSVNVAGAGSFALGDEHGLYIGVRQFAEPRYLWYGPFTSTDEWRAMTDRDSNFAEGNAAYVTLAVFNGDIVRVDGVAVDLGG